MYKMILMVAVVSVAFVGPSMAQDVTVSAPPANTVLPMCHIVFCQTDTRKCLVFDDKGNWLRSVRLMQMAMRYPDKAYVALKMYEGIYEPTKARVEKRFVNKIVSVTETEFQKMIDDLHKGGEVDLDRKKKEPSGE